MWSTKPSFSLGVLSRGRPPRSDRSGRSVQMSILLAVDPPISDMGVTQPVTESRGLLVMSSALTMHVVWATHTSGS